MSEENEQVEDRKGAAVKFPPPLIFLLLIFLGFGLHRLIPLPMGLPDSVQWLGYVFCLLAIAVPLQVNGVFNRVGTAIEPWKPTNSLVTDGLYRWSRNPIYTAFCLFNIGVGVAGNNLWVTLSFIPGAVLVYLIAIAKEENYLQQKFGEEYLAYKRSVRRWI
ncbi:MAG: isoprenylcysteine carboxylmethyltransferase family protein [Proteobacteria bacterium]|nr:isoprenylcysteine carboxylmethyltransferase family protein [Pseudomonadota bacterium]MDA0927885.1 isoprenylcysteine carboxylmethyltransferase family protein [Pseudomonadota bacterium]